MGYVNKESCSAAGIALAVIALLAVSVRIVYRLRANHKLSHVRYLNHLDDLFCLLAVIPTIGTAVVLVYGKLSLSTRSMTWKSAYIFFSVQAPKSMYSANTMTLPMRRTGFQRRLPI